MSQTVTPEANALFQKAMASLGRREKTEAARYLFQAVKLQPDYFDALYNLGLILQELDKVSEAVSCYEQALRIKHDSAEAWNNLGVAHHSVGRSDQAVECHRRALKLKPADSSYYNNLANALRGMDQPAEAIRELQAALQFDPSNWMLRHNLGNALREAGRIAESVSEFDTILQAQPSFAEAHFDRAFSLLLGGDLLRGWDEYEWRWRRKNHPPLREFAQPAWRGEDLKDLRLFVYAEQGAGDTIQFARYLPELLRLGAKVFVECPASLVGLLSTITGLEKVIDKGDVLPAFDLVCPLVSLPRCFKTTLDTIPAAVPYLYSPRNTPPLPQVADAKPDNLKIGLAWAGNPAHHNDRHRSIRLELLQPLLAHADLNFFSLQIPRDPAFGSPDLASRCLDLSPLIHDYSDTAALMSQLDLIISVDTSVAHLAGALGRPVWLLLPYAPDWRWLLGPNDSPWYPTMRLFRQPHPGDWAAVVKEVETKLADFKKTHHKTGR